MEDDPVRRENLKLRSDILRVITETLKERELTQQQAAEFRLQEDLEELLDKAANRLHRSKNWIINQAVKEYHLQRDLNEQQRWQETVEALKSASAGKIVGVEKVHAWLESWGKEDELPPPKP